MKELKLFYVVDSYTVAHDEREALEIVKKEWNKERRKTKELHGMDMGKFPFTLEDVKQDYREVLPTQVGEIEWRKVFTKPIYLGWWAVNAEFLLLEGKTREMAVKAS